MLKKNLSILIAASVLSLGVTALAQQEKKENTVQFQNQSQTTEQYRAEERKGSASQGAATEAVSTKDQMRIRDRKMDGTGDHQPDRMRDRDLNRINDHQGMGMASGRGGGMRGPRN
jgi:hypothetical protein